MHIRSKINELESQRNNRENETNWMMVLWKEKKKKHISVRMERKGERKGGNRSVWGGEREKERKREEGGRGGRETDLKGAKSQIL